MQGYLSKVKLLSGNLVYLRVDKVKFYIFIVSVFSLQGKAAFFIHFERLKGIRSSSILTLYWVLYVVLWIFVFRTQVTLLLKDEVCKNYYAGMHIVGSLSSLAAT